MLHHWILLFVAANILASPVAQIADDQKLDDPFLDPNLHNVIASADTDIINCVSNSLDGEDQSFDNGDILRRERSSTCSSHQHKTQSPDTEDPKYKTLPDTQTVPNREQLNKEILSQCPYHDFSFLLYCSGPEVLGYKMFIDYTDEENEARTIYLWVLNCLNARESTYGPLTIDRPLDLLTNDKGQYCCKGFSPTRPLWAGNDCYKLSQHFHPPQWTRQRMEEYREQLRDLPDSH